MNEEACKGVGCEVVNKNDFEYSNCVHGFFSEVTKHIDNWPVDYQPER